MSELYDQARDGTGTYCCPCCLHWYKTPEEKQRCMTDWHGYEILEVTNLDG